MVDMAGKTYWIVGASEGLGRELAYLLDAAGASLLLSARNAERLESLCAELRDARALPFDVTDAEAAAAACDAAGKIDALVYNAGAYDPMSTQDWDRDAALGIVEVNLMGAMRILGDVVPAMAKRGAGDITLIGSLAGYRGLPASIGYSASKAGVISLAETMRFDLKGTGVCVRVVNPGFIKTRLTDKNTFKMPQIMTPETAADRVFKAMQRKRFRTDFPKPFAWVIRVIDLLPDWVVYRGK
ncbi:SDR family NAD(P)-dependent oxidoreductase [Celeribacter sp.]|uniref:SDR family NAD(P)-dependent oxidoreductase n=1 Tax=Celeribacter sp. TaxID=1890673 RepID=UPI003A934BA9